MPRYPKWVTNPKKTTIGARLDPSLNKDTIVSEIRAFAQKLEKLLDEYDVFSINIGTENWDYDCYEHDSAIEVNLYYYVPLTDEEIAANKAAYEKDAAKRRETYKRTKAKAEKAKLKELEKIVKENKELIQGLLDKNA